MILGNLSIKENIRNGNIVITPYNESQLNTNSYNVRLHNELLVYTDDVLDCKKENKTKTIIIGEEGFELHPNELYLGRTVEYTETYNCVPMLEGRSSIARLGIDVHITAGFGDRGFKGFWTLEIRCTKPVIIYPNIEIAQLYYVACKGCNGEYNGKYQNNSGIQASRLYKDFEK